MAGEELLDDGDLTEEAKVIEEEVIEEKVVEEKVGEEGVALREGTSLRPKSDIFTLMLILAFVAFLTGCIIAGRELWDHYDVQFLVFTKD